MRTISMAKRQQNLLNSGFLDLSGSSRLDFQPISLDALSSVLASLAIEFATTAQDNLNKADQVASGKTADSIVPTQVLIMGKVYKVDINIGSWYDYLNKGVKGWQDEKGGGSPYQFKRTRPSIKMMQEIRKWVIKEGLKGRGRENRHPMASKRDQRRSKISDTSTRTAYAISTSVKKKGLRGSHFWDNTVQTMEQKIAAELGAALKVDIINNLTNIN